jgi:hypothetical protein
MLRNIIRKERAVKFQMRRDLPHKTSLFSSGKLFYIIFIEQREESPSKAAGGFSDERDIY